MRGIKLTNLAVSVAVISSTILSIPVHAQINNQSDNTGTNVWSNPIPRLDPGKGIDPQIINAANQLSQELDKTYADYAAAEAEAAQNPRRFARGTNDSSLPCVNPYAAKLNSLQEQAKTLLNRLDRNQLPQLRSSPSFRIW